MGFLSYLLSLEVTLLPSSSSSIFTLKPYETVKIPFFQIQGLQNVVEIFNPVELPTVFIDAAEETVFIENTLVSIIQWLYLMESK